MDGIEARVLDAGTRVAAVERDNDVVALATAREKEQWQKVEKIEQALQRVDANDPSAAEMREKARLIRGVLYWDLNSSYKARLWRAKKEMRELDVAAKEARRRWTLIERARDESPKRTDEFDARVAKLEPRLAGLAERLARASEAQNRYLANIAIAELEAQKARLAAYSVQAQFALASIYDRAASGTGGAP
jgi:chromosome segregation ATPase